MMQEEEEEREPDPLSEKKNLVSSQPPLHPSKI